MKKMVLSITVIAVFTISSFSAALASPGKNKDNPGQSKKPQVQEQTQNQVQIQNQVQKQVQVQVQDQVIITTSSSIEKLQVIEDKTKLKNNDKGQAFGKVKKEALPPVIKIGNLQISTSAVINGFKSLLVWDKTTNTITISKNGIIIKFVGDSKIFVNGVQVSIASIKNGKGKLVPMEFIQKTLNGKPVARTTTESAITTTGAAITTTGAAITTTGAAITTTGSGINH